MFCIKVIEQRHLITNILKQLNGVKISDICPRNQAFFIMLRFSSRYKFARNYGFSNFSPTRRTITLLEKRQATRMNILGLPSTRIFNLAKNINNGALNLTWQVLNSPWGTEQGDSRKIRDKYFGIRGFSKNIWVLQDFCFQILLFMSQFIELFNFFWSI